MQHGHITTQFHNPGDHNDKHFLWLLTKISTFGMTMQSNRLTFRSRTPEVVQQEVNYIHLNNDRGSTVTSRLHQ